MDKIRTQLTDEISYGTVERILEFLKNYCDFLNIRTLQAVLLLKASNLVFFYFIIVLECSCYLICRSFGI